MYQDNFVPLQHQTTKAIEIMKTKIYLNYLAKEEKERMTAAMPFLINGGNDGKQELLEIANDLYNESVTLDFAWDNGNCPNGWRAKNRKGDKHFYTIIDIEEKDLTDKAIETLGKCDDHYFRWFHGITLCKEDRQLYLISFSEHCSPNWNKEYDAETYMELKDVDFPILRENSLIYRMDNALHMAINDRLMADKQMFTEKDGEVIMGVKDQHGNYTQIKGVSRDDVFRSYANNFTGYRNFRRQMASEWEIVDDNARKDYEEWKQTAKNLKSDFDKFYGSGIVD